ncbi:MAG: TetR family transcriptional regulator, partial [Caulobacteraceae bacterium]
MPATRTTASRKAATVKADSAKADAGTAEAPKVEAQATAPPKRPAKPAASKADLLDIAGECALALASDRPWSEISLRDIARASGVSFAELYARAPGKDALLDRLARRFDAAALAAAEDDASAEAHDRLFEAVMARLEAMEPHRAALIAIAQARGVLAIVPHLPRTARA